MMKRVFLIGLSAMMMAAPLWAVPEVKEVKAADIAVNVPAKDTLRALCIGNSFTYFFDSYDMLARIAASNGHALDVKAAYVGGYTFYRHLQDLNTVRAIEDALYVGAYDVVFLQEQSQAFARYGADNKQYKLEKDDTKNLVARVREHSPKARIWLEATWSYRSGNYGTFGSFERFDKMMTKGTKQLAKATHTHVSPIGEAFRIVRAERADINLYHPDEKHQSAEGSYLKSCVNYLLIYGGTLSDETDACGIEKATAQYLQAVAQRVVK